MAQRPRRQRQLSAQYRSDSENDQNYGISCSICEQNEPEGLASDMIFWVDCDVCGAWVHNVGAFG